MEVAGGAEKYLAGRSEMGHMFGVGKHRASRRSLLAAFHRLPSTADDSNGLFRAGGGAFFPE